MESGEGTIAREVAQALTQQKKRRKHHAGSIVPSPRVYCRCHLILVGGGHAFITATLLLVLNSYLPTTASEWQISQANLVRVLRDILIID